jgi:hypothetical protein
MPARSRMHSPPPSPEFRIISLGTGLSRFADRPVAGQSPSSVAREWPSSTGTDFVIGHVAGTPVPSAQTNGARLRLSTVVRGNPWTNTATVTQLIICCQGLRQACPAAQSLAFTMVSKKVGNCDKWVDDEHADYPPSFCFIGNLFIYDCINDHPYFKGGNRYSNYNNNW